jgi:ubiquinone/menaquinone biosynthesis C-methylase UbiE
MPSMRRLVNRDELLDGPLDDPIALAANLRDLRRINRLFGGVELSRRALDVLVGDRTGLVTLLDVGTGAGDIPAALQIMEAPRGRHLRITALDSRPEVVAAALAGAPWLASLTGFRWAVGDGRYLSDADRSHDVVHASLVLHHLAPDDAVLLLREMGRVAAVGVIVNDLARGWMAWLGAWLLAHALTRSRLTRHDAPLSVRRAYRPAEVRALLATAGLRPIAMMGGLLGHRFAIAAVPVATE